MWVDGEVALPEHRPLRSYRWNLLHILLLTLRQPSLRERSYEVNLGIRVDELGEEERSSLGFRAVPVVLASDLGDRL